MVGISGIGAYIPDEKIAVRDLCPGVSDYELSRIGAESVLYEPKLTATEMAVKAAEAAIADAYMDPEDIGLIINTQASLHDYLLWVVSAEVQDKLKAHNADFFDMYQGCSGFVTAIITAESFIKSGNYDKVLINSAEKWDASIRKRNIGRLVYGECGAAVILEADSERNQILSHHTISRGDFNDISRMRIGTINPPDGDYPDNYYNFDITNIEKSRNEMVPINVENFYTVGEKAAEKAGLKLSDIDYIIFPSVGFGLFEKVMTRYGHDLKQTNFSYISQNGDCGSADVFMNYYKMINDGKIKSGDNVLFLVQGAGFTWGSLLIRA